MGKASSPKLCTRRADSCGSSCPGKGRAEKGNLTFSPARREHPRPPPAISFDEQRRMIDEPIYCNPAEEVVQSGSVREEC